MTDLASSESRLEARNELLRIGVSEVEVQRLLTAYPLERIQRQIRWLRLRKVYKHSAFIVSAIVNDYEPPAALFEEAALNSAQAAAAAPSSILIAKSDEEETDED